MKYFVILCLFAITGLSLSAQMIGSFQQGNDGHIYFSATNQSGVAFNVQIIAISTDRRNSEVSTITSNGGFYLGPSTPWQWYWKKGDKISIVYPNGQNQTWVCPQNDNVYRKSPSFQGKHCNGTVGCNCPGFSPITNGEIWQREYCRHCGHKKSYHK